MKSWKYIFIVLVLANIVLFYAIFRHDNNLHLVFCDVGQGDGILIYKKNIQIVIDGGPDRKILSCLGKHMPFYDRQVEYVVLTNSDADHYGGLVDIFKRYEVLGYGTSGVIKDDPGFKELVSSISTENIVAKSLVVGGGLLVDGISFNVLWPEKNLLASSTPLTGSAVNEQSLVLELRYGAFNALLTGDIVPPSTDYAAEGLSSSVTVLKVPHHGSKNGLTEKLLEVTKPKVAVISVGKDNRYGHPHREVLEALERWNLKTLRTDQEGEVEVITDGKTWRLK